MLYDPQQKILTTGADTLFFDDDGRLTAVEDAYGNRMTITFTSGRITSVTDGAGREFGFAYASSGFLTSITAPDNTSVLYYLFGQPTHGDDISGR